MTLTMPTGRYRYGPQSIPRAVAALEATVGRMASASTTAADLDKNVPASAMTVVAGAYSMTRDIAGMDTVDQTITFLPAPVDESIASAPLTAWPSFYLVSYQVVGTTSWSAQVRIEDPHDGSQVTMMLPGLATNTQYIAAIITVTTAGVASEPVFTTFTTPADSVPPVVPSTPTVTALIANLKCVWDGKDNVGANMVSDWSFTEVHASTSNGFTPSVSTLIGSILADSTGTVIGGTKIIPSPAYTPLYVKLIAVDYSGNRSAASVQAGPVTSLKVDGVADVIANSITAASIYAGTITGTQIAANTVTADKLGTGTLDVNQTITVGTPAGTRIEVGKDPLGTSNPGIRLYRDQITAPTVNLDAVTGNAQVTGGLATGITGDPRISISPAYFGNMVTNGTFDASLSSWTEYDSSGNPSLAAMTPSLDTGTKLSGAASLKLAGSAALFGQDCYMSQSIACASSTSYVVSVMVNCNHRTNGGNSNWCLFVLGNGGTQGFTTLTGLTGAGVWKQHKISVTTGAAETSLEIRLCGVAGTGSYINFDNVFMGPGNAYYGAMPMSAMVEYIPATTDELNGGLYTGETYNGDTNASTDQSSILLRSPGWTTPGSASQSSVYLTSDTRTTSANSRMVTIDPALTVAKMKLGGGTVSGVNRASRYRSSGFVHNSNGGWLEIDFQTSDATVQDDGTIYATGPPPLWTAPTSGMYALSATMTAAATAGTYGLLWINQGTSKRLAYVLSTASQVLTATTVTYLAAGDSVKVQAYQNAGASITIPQDSSGIFRATFTRVSG